MVSVMKVLTWILEYSFEKGMQVVLVGKVVHKSYLFNEGRVQEGTRKHTRRPSGQPSMHLQKLVTKNIT